MKRMEFEAFDRCAEMLSFTDGGGGCVELVFNNLTEGFLELNGISHRVTEGRVTLNITLLPEGELTPILTANGRVITLPTLYKDGQMLRPTEPSNDYVRELSLRERRLKARVISLEARIEALEKSVFSTKIF